MIVGILAALFQATLPWLLCALRGDPPTFIMVPWFEPETPDPKGFYCGNYLSQLWRFGDATAFCAALGVVAGTSAFAEAAAKSRWALLVPPVAALFVVPNFVYADVLVATGSFREALRYTPSVFFSDGPFLYIWHVVAAYVVLLEVDLVLRLCLDDETTAHLLLAGVAFFATGFLVQEPRGRFCWHQGLVAAACAAGLAASRKLAKAWESRRDVVEAP